jgi:hypothetical protein
VGAEEVADAIEAFGHRHKVPRASSAEAAIPHDGPHTPGGGCAVPDVRNEAKALVAGEILVE